MPPALHPRTAPLNSVGRRCPSAPYKITVWPATKPPVFNRTDQTGAPLRRQKLGRRRSSSPTNRSIGTTQNPSPRFPFKLQSRQKPLQSCIIKANQGKRQIRESSCWMGRTGVQMPNRVPRKNPLLGERKQVREDVPPTGQAASSCLSDPGHPDLRNPRPVPDFPLQSCLIKPNQAIR